MAIGEAIGAGIPAFLTSFLGTAPEQRAARVAEEARQEDLRRWLAGHALRLGEEERRKHEFAEGLRLRSEEAAARRRTEEEALRVSRARESALGAIAEFVGRGPTLTEPMGPSVTPTPEIAMAAASPEKQALAGLIRAGLAPPEAILRSIGAGEPRKPMEVSRGATLVDIDKREPIFVAPPEAPKPGEPSLEKQYLLSKAKPTGEQTHFDREIIRVYEERAKREARIRENKSFATAERIVTLVTQRFRAALGKVGQWMPLTPEQNAQIAKQALQEAEASGDPEVVSAVRGIFGLPPPGGAAGGIRPGPGMGTGFPPPAAGVPPQIPGTARGRDPLGLRQSIKK